MMNFSKPYFQDKNKVTHAYAPSRIEMSKRERERVEKERVTNKR